MAQPAWVIKPITLVPDSPSEVAWEHGYPSTVTRKYVVELEIPATLTTTAEKEAWFHTNVEGANFVSTSSPFYGVPVPGSAHPSFIGLTASDYKVSVPGYLSKRVFVTVTYLRPEMTTSNATDNGQVIVPFGSWGVQVGWTNAKLAGADYRGKPFMTVAGEVVNVQTNVPMFTLTRSIKTNDAGVVQPSINSLSVTRAGFTIPKHCGLRVQSNVENTGQDVGEFARILTEQIVYIPRLVSVATGTIVNPDGAGGEITTLSDVGSYDTLVLHQGFREKVGAKIDFVSYLDKASGKRMTIHALSVLDATGKHVEPDVNGNVTPYYLAFQNYPSTVWG